MAKNKKKNKNTNLADKNSQEESFEKEEQLSEEKSSEKEVESIISSEMITALEEKVLRAHAEVENVRRTSQKEILKALRKAQKSKKPIKTNGKLVFL